MCKGKLVVLVLLGCNRFPVHHKKVLIVEPLKSTREKSSPTIQSNPIQSNPIQSNPIQSCIEERTFIK
ncbi:hypothetical protein Hanom_Chr04g00354431 [Helianthus anomalus]